MAEVSAGRDGKGAVARFLPAAANISVWIGGLFAGAGTLHWAGGWLSVALYLTALTIAGIALRRYNPELIRERGKWRRKDTEPFDRVFLALMLPLVSVQPVIAGLDAIRFRWAVLPPELLWPGLTFLAIGWVLIVWVLAVNRHAETTVRIQSDRDHAVVTGGPYRLIRHPMYTGAILMFLSFPLIWGSGWALAIGGAVAALFIWRTVREDRTLHDRLPGYPDYAVRTRFRLIPGVW